MTPSADHVRSLRAQAEELRDAAGLMKFRETRAALIILAESYDRMADELDSPHKTHLHLAGAARH